MDLGMGPGFERIHWILDEAFDDGAPDELTDTFLAAVEHETGFAGGPMYAVLHESIYGQSFTGEMIFPWMFEQVAALRPFRDAAEALAARTDWADLYDLDRLAANDVPVEAAVYFDDMFVDAGLSLETAAHVGNARAWVTNEFEHDGLRMGDVFRRLLERMDARGASPR
jgi:proline iminopeptidase